MNGDRLIQNPECEPLHHVATCKNVCNSYKQSTSWDVLPKACARTSASFTSKSRALIEFKIRVASRRTMRRLDSPDVVQHIHRMRVICEPRLHLGGVACAQLTSLTDTRTIAFAKPAAKVSLLPACHNPWVRSKTDRSNARASLRMKGGETEPPRSIRARAASKEVWQSRFEGRERER